MARKNDMGFWLLSEVYLEFLIPIFSLKQMIIDNPKQVCWKYVENEREKYYSVNFDLYNINSIIHG